MRREQPHAGKEKNMDRILFINACVRPESRTRELAQAVLDGLSGQVEEVNLGREHIGILDWEALQKRDALVHSGDFSAPMFRYARQLAGADEIVIAAPYWDLAFPALLKIYFESVMVSGLTFRYTPEGRPESLCRARRLIYVTTAGGPIVPFHFGYDYVEALARNFFGIPDVRCLTAENLDIVGVDPVPILAKAKEEAKALVSG